MTSCYDLVIHHSRWLQCWLFLCTVARSPQTQREFKQRRFWATHVYRKWVLARKFVQNHGPRLQKVHFRLTYVAQKRRCLNPLILLSRWHDTDVPLPYFFKGEVGAAVHNYFADISHYHHCTECYACSKSHVTLLTLTLLMQLSLHVKESKTVLDSGFHTVDSGFQVLDSSLCQWNLDSGFQLFTGFQIHWAVFRIPKPRIPDSQA